MSYTETENRKLRKDNGDEKIVDWRTHSNANMDTIDEAVQNLVEVCANAKSLLGQLGLDESGNPLIDAASARNTLGAATSGGASKSLYAAEQSIATNASNITKLQNSVSHVVLSGVDALNLTRTSSGTCCLDFVVGSTKYRLQWRNDGISYATCINGQWTTIWSK